MFFKYYMFKPRFYHIINVLYPHLDNGLHVIVYSHVVEGEKLGGGGLVGPTNIVSRQENIT